MAVLPLLGFPTSATQDDWTVVVIVESGYFGRRLAAEIHDNHGLSIRWGRSWEPF